MVHTRKYNGTLQMVEEAILRISVSGRNLNGLRYADDTTLLVDSESKLQRLY